MAPNGEECSTIDMIGTNEECQTAASQVGELRELPFNGEVETTEMMKGCYRTDNNKVAFNKISASSSTAERNNRHGICKKQGICLCIYIKFKLICTKF